MLYRVSSASGRDSTISSVFDGQGADDEVGEVVEGRANMQCLPVEEARVAGSVDVFVANVMVACNRYMKLGFLVT